MLNRQLTMGNSKDNMMASDARRTFAAENEEQSKVKKSYQQDNWMIDR